MSLTNLLETSSLASKDIVFYIFIGVAAVAVLALLIFLAVTIYRHIKYNFSFESNGGTKIPSIKVKKGEPFILPDSPKKQGYAFAGWYADKECTIRFIDAYVLKNKTKKVYAKWYESNIPEKFVKYFEKLRNLMLSFAKVGVAGNTSIYESEVLARLFADESCVSLYVALGRKSMTNGGFVVEDASEEYEDTPSKLEITEKDDYKQAVRIITYLMAKKGLQNVGLGGEPEPMKIEEREHGFEFKLENDKIAISLPDYFELLRIYAKSFALANPNGAEEGETVVRIYLAEECVELYLALETTGSLEKSDRFEDTPSLFRVQAEVPFIEKAYRYIDRAMAKKGMVKRNENANLFVIRHVEKGCGCAFVVNYGEEN